LKISVVVPTYNEAENLPSLVSALFSVPLELHLLVVDDNSPDGTSEVAASMARQNSRIRLLRRERKEGLRSAYLAGIREVLGLGTDAVLQMDADLSHDPRAIPAMAATLDSADLVLGSRYISGGSLDQDWPAWRRGLSAFGNLYARTILGIPASDVTTGFRLWRAEALARLPLELIRSNGYVFLVEMAYMAHCLEYRIGEVPIHFAERRHGDSKMSFRIQAEAALRVWQVRWQHRKLRQMGIGARLR
jgi:dolichol-phosphate mannosyltransferase